MEKAFDKLEHQPFFKILEKFGFGSITAPMSRNYSKGSEALPLTMEQLQITLQLSDH